MKNNERLEKMFAAWNSKARAVTRGRLYNRHLADECVQQTNLNFIQRFRHGKGKPPTNPEAYYFTVLRNATIDSVNQERRHHDKLEEAFRHGRRELRHHDDGREHISDEEVALERALNHLKQIDRGILELNVVHGFSINEIAEQLNMSANSVTKRKSRALEYLRETITRLMDAA